MIPERLRPLRVPRYLQSLLDDVDHLAQRLMPHVADARAATIMDEAALASVQLDGARLDVVPSPDQVERASREVGSARARSTTWLDDLSRNIPDEADAAVGALEWSGARAALDADDLVPTLVDAPLDALRDIHRRLTAGLVAAADAGTARRTEQAVLDGNTGRVVYRVTPVAEVEERVDALAR